MYLKLMFQVYFDESFLISSLSGPEERHWRRSASRQSKAKVRQIKTPRDPRLGGYMLSSLWFWEEQLYESAGTMDFVMKQALGGKYSTEAPCPYASQPVNALVMFHAAIMREQDSVEDFLAA